MNWLSRRNGVHGGAVCVRGTGVSAEVLASRFAGGDSVSLLARDYNLTMEQVEDAIRAIVRSAMGRQGLLRLNVLLECGALYRELPPHAWAFRPDAPVLTLGRCQAWDCFGGTAQAIEYAYLRELPVQMIADKAKGGYLFTVEWGDNGFSRYPEQSKALHALSMYGGVTFQPGNAFTVHESSFTANDGDCSWLRRQRHVWGAEGDSK